MIDRSTVEFLRKLKRNNNREWFAKHKEEYQVALNNIEEYVSELILAISSFDKSVKGLDPKQALFRIYRDVRFANNKMPYKISFGVLIGSQGTKSRDAMYYFHVEPENSFLMGGLHHPDATKLSEVRMSIDKQGVKMNRILSSASFKRLFGKMEGEKLKTSPRGFDDNHPFIELLRYKDFMAVHNISDARLFKSDLAKYSAKVYKEMKPFNDFLNGV